MNRSSPHQDRHLREVCRVAAWCHAGAVPYSPWAVGWSDVWLPLSSLEVVSTSKEMRFVKIKSEVYCIPWSNTIHVVVVICSDQGSLHKVSQQGETLSTELGISEVQPNRLTRTNCWISIRAPDSWASNYGVILLHQTSLVNHSVFLKQRPNIASSNKVPPAKQPPFLPLADVFEV